jgi:hypothetical protein
MDSIRTTVEYIRSLLKRAIQIDERVTYIYATSRPDVNVSFYNSVEKIKNAYEKLTSVDDTTEPMKIGHLIGLCDTELRYIVNSVKSLNLTMMDNASNTYILATMSELNSFEHLFEQYASNTVKEDVNTYLVKRIVDKDDSEIENMYTSYPSATSLYASYLQYKFDNTEESKHQLYYNMLERAKTLSIVGNEHVKTEQPSKKTMPLQRYGVVAVRQHLTLDELSCLYLGNGCTSNTPDIASFITAAAVIKLNVLVIRNITKYPVEFNIWKLINKSDAQGFIFAEYTGVNEKIMERLDTISEINADNINERDYGYTSEPHVYKDGSDWIIIRTINGIHWDAMSNKKTIVGLNEYAFSNDRLRVEDDVVKRVLRGPSPRIDVYNRNKNTIFQNIAKNPKNVDNDTKRDNKALIDTLIHRITNRIIAYVDKSLVPLPTSQSKLEAAILDPMFIEIANVEMLKTYAECGVDTTLPIDELVGTFISDVDMTIIVQFSRNLKMNMIEMGPKSKTFKEYKGDVLKTRLYNIFVDIIKKSVSSTIRSKENIYEKLLVKNNLLKAIV